MKKKLRFYDRHGVSEYYEYDSDRMTLKGWMRSENRLVPIENTDGWISPILGIRFEIEDDLVIFRPDGQKFLSIVEMDKQHRIFMQEAGLEIQRAEQEKKRIHDAEAKAEQERMRAQMLEEKLKALEKLIRLQSESEKEY